jgi:hypothetical protein
MEVDLMFPDTTPTRQPSLSSSISVAQSPVQHTPDSICRALASAWQIRIQRDVVRGQQSTITAAFAPVDVSPSTPLPEGSFSFHSPACELTTRGGVDGVDEVFHGGELVQTSLNDFFGPNGSAGHN